MFSFSNFNNNRIKDNTSKFIVSVNGTNVPVYTCRKSKDPFNVWWPGHQRDIKQSEEAYFVNLISDERLDFEVFVNVKYQEAKIKPYSKNIDIQRGNSLKFTINKNGLYILELDNHHTILYIFVSKEIKCTSKNDVTYYFGPGVHNVGQINLKSNESLYIDKDAYVYGNIFSEKAENIHIFGNGIFDQSDIERPGEDCLISGNVKFEHCKNVLLEGVGFTNSCSWCASIFNCFNLTFDGVKIFGQWRYNTDGVDIVNSQDITIKNSFVHSFDDSIVIKAYDKSLWVHGIEDCGTCNKNILIENNVVWCDWGRCLELGFETACLEYSNILYRNIDVIHSAEVALSIHNGDYAEIHNINYEDIRVEFDSYDNPGQLQSSDDMVYTKNNEINNPVLFSVCNNRFRTSFKKEEYIDERVKKISYNHDIHLKNISVYYDNRIPKINNKFNIWILLYRVVPNVKFDNITIQNLFVNKKKITADEVMLDGQASEIINIK